MPIKKGKGGAADAQAKIAASYAQALARSFKDFDITPAKAERMVGELRDQLEVWTSEGTTPVLLKRYKLAIRDTEACHTFAGSLFRFSEQSKILRKYSDDDLAVIARNNVELTFPKPSDRNEEREILPAVKAIFDEFLPLPNESEFSSAQYYEKLVGSEQRTLRVLLDTYGSVATLCLICRGMFYLAVISVVGGDLGRDAKRKNLRETIDALAIHLTTTIVPALEVFTFARELSDLTNALFSTKAKFEKLKRDQAQAAEINRAATDFVDTFRHALATWSKWAIMVSAAAADQSRLFAKNFARH